MKRPRPPIAVSVLAVLTGAYWLANGWLDRDPAARPLEVPYHLLRHMERDARLRSSSPVDRVLPDQRLALVWDFDTAERLEQQLRADPALAVRWSPASLVPDRGSASMPVPDPGLTLVLPLPAPERAPDCLQLEGRLRLKGPSAGLQARLSLQAAPSPRAAAVLEARAADDALPVPALQIDDLSPEEWWEFSVSLAGWDAVVPPDGLALTLVTDASEVEWDELVLRSAPRLRGLMIGGQPRNTGVTEGTRERKRFVRRGGDERLCLALAAPSLLDLTLEVPRFARLEFGVSTLAEAVPRRASEFTVAVSREGRFEETLLRRSVGPAEASAFADHSLDLSDLAGERVRLQLRVEAADPAAASVVLVGDPVLVARPEVPLPPVFLVTAPQDWLEGGEAGRLMDGALRIPRYRPAHRDADPDLLSLLASQPPPVEQDPRRLTVLAPRVQNLVEVLGTHGYESLAVSSPARRGPVLQGFLRRFLEPERDGVGALSRWLEPRPGRPLLVLLDLPRVAPGDTLVAWKKELVRRGLWNGSHVLLVPAGGIPGLALWRQPQPIAEPGEVGPEVGALDLAPTLLAALGLPPWPEFRGRTLALPSGVEDPGSGEPGLMPDAVRGAATELRLAPLLPRRVTAILDEGQAAWPLPPGGSK